MSIDTTPTMPGYRWAAQNPAPVTAGRPAAFPPPRPAGPQRPAAPINAWAGPWMPGQPAVAPAPVWPQPRPAGAASSSRKWIVAAIAVAGVVLALVAGLIATTRDGADKPRVGADRAATASAPSSQPSAVASPPPPAVPLVPDEALPSLLLDTPTVNAIMGTHDLAVNPKLTTTKLYIDTTDKPECGGVWANANKTVYSGSAWQSVQTQYLVEPDNPRHEVYQSVVSFPTAQTASDFVAKEGKRWPACNGTSITTTNADTPAQTWWIATVSQQGELLTSIANREGARGLSCQHALTARNNVVVDVEACGWDVAQQGTTIAQRIAEHISRTL